jgi:hypothetical protein
MRRYESYKDSGVEWLGEVPSHWGLTIGMNVFRENKRDNKGMKEKTVLSLSYGQIIIKPEEKLVGLVPESFETYQIVEPNDIIIRCTDLQNDQTSLRTGLAKDKGIITSAYLNLKVINNHSAKFLHYYLHALDITKVLYKFGSGLRQNLSFLDFKRLPIIDIPLSEQQKIAQFLDDKTAKIDQAVDLAEKQIALLKEHKQILIQNAVTRGLNPDAPLKDSGVEWIGQVPEHWEVKKLKFVSKINQHTLPENTNGSLSIKYVDIGSVSFENGIEKVENFSFKNAPSRARRLANRGDIVVSTVRTYLKAITMVKEEHQDCIFSTGFAVITSNKCLEDNFFELYAKSDAFTEQVSVFSKGMSYPAINSTDLSNLWITVPPISEQQKIADYLEIQVSKINQAIALKTAHIEKLKEYKSVLINDVVTGKVQVSV